MVTTLGEQSQKMEEITEEIEVIFHVCYIEIDNKRIVSSILTKESLILSKRLEIVNYNFRTLIKPCFYVSAVKIF